ncbi:unnamed protein product, partial [Iphiclides podalirius]
MNEVVVGGEIFNDGDTRLAYACTEACMEASWIKKRADSRGRSRPGRLGSPGERGRRTRRRGREGRPFRRRAIDRYAYLPAAAAEHPPSARLSARRSPQPGQFSPLHGDRLARRLRGRPRGRLFAHRGRLGRGRSARDTPAECPLSARACALSHPPRRPPSRSAINNSGYAAGAYVG